MDDSVTYDEMPTSILQLVNERCNRYESDRELGQARPIDDYIADLDDQARTAVRAELIALSKAYEQTSSDVPATIGDYNVVRCLGRGGMGAVFLARDPRLGRQVAVKVLRPALAADPAARDRFRREALAAGRLDHPNVVPALDAGEENGCPYLVSTYVDGEDLAHLVRRTGPLDYKLAICYVAQAASGLEHAHERGIVHRDVKPANLILGSDGVVRVLDLGLARIRDFSSSDQSTTGVFMGTRSYAAPEQSVAPATVDARSDVYGLGGVLHFLLTGRAPRPWEDFRGLPANASQALRRMLASDPAKRPASMGEVIRLLESSPRPSRRDALIAGAITVVGVAGGAAAYFKPWQREPPTPPPEERPFAFSQEQRDAAAKDRLPIEFTDEFGISFVLIPPGETWLGTHPEEIERIVEREPDSDYHRFIRSEVRRVTGIKFPFYLARTELTIGQMKAIVGTRRRLITEVETGEIKGYGFRNGRWALEPQRSWDNAGEEYPLTDDHPAINLTWNDATKLAQIMRAPKDAPRYFVPNEDLWEYACRAGAAPDGSDVKTDAIEDVAVFDQPGPLPVRSRLPNKWGLYEMLGNLLEWCLAGPGPLGVPLDSTRLAPLHGGKFNDKADRIRPAARVWQDKSTPLGGLRLAMPAVSKPKHDIAIG